MVKEWKALIVGSWIRSQYGQETKKYLPLKKVRTLEFSLLLWNVGVPPKVSLSALKASYGKLLMLK